MIRIGKPYVVSDSKYAKLICEVSVDDLKKEIFFQVDKEYERYLCYERCDAYLIVLFYWAMRNNHNIICDGLVSEDLLYQINEYLIPVLYRYGDNKLNMIDITCSVGTNVKTIGAVGTGLTCGVDSFHAIINNLSDKYPSRKLTHLTIMSLADSYKKDGNYDLISKKIYEKARIVSKEFNLPIIEIKSNIRELFPIPPMHTFIRMFGVYALQKLFGTYYFASGFPVWSFNINDSVYTDSARYDLFLCSNLSSRNLVIYSEGSMKTRIEKIKFIVDNEIVKKHLHVCVKDYINCGKCSKCIRTMCALDSINKLDSFRESFDVDYYYENIDFYLEEILKMYEKEDLFIYEFIDDFMKKYSKKDIFLKYKFKRKKDFVCNRCYRLSDYNDKKNK